MAEKATGWGVEEVHERLLHSITGVVCPQDQEAVSRVSNNPGKREMGAVTPKATPDVQGRTASAGNKDGA